ncbi:internalin, putative [hydrothermal vent metagenome]|uniref:Internalin, putative n=1 Tax=hydrothermal vent metagenome TaxID=652676 RepID=A0A3B0TM77_9ZZZZ
MTETYEVTQPDIVEETIVQPTCMGDSDGSIAVVVNGGNGSFTYSWNTGATTNSISSLSAGSYTVTITGFGNGPLTRTYVIEDPLPLSVDLGENRVLCADQELVLDATVEDETATYTWTSDNGFSSTEPSVTLTTTGNYTVTVGTASGCSATGTVFVDISTAEINAEFAMSSQVFVGEKVLGVDISFPLPETIEWVFPEEATVIKQDSDEIELTFKEAGEYEIGITTTQGDCIAQKTKKIIVVEKDATIQEEDTENGKKLIEEFIIYPNPTSGKFTADVNLTERGNISIKVFNLTSNAMMAFEKDRGKTAYSIPFDLSGLPAGVYAVLLETPYGDTLRKIIIK